MINNEIRELQLVQLKMLDELDRVSNILKIGYFLAYGTLLGAVRYNVLS